MLPSVDSLLACRFMPEPPRGYSTAMPVSTLLWMLLPTLPTFLPVDASVVSTEKSALGFASFILTKAVVSCQASHVKTGQKLGWTCICTENEGTRNIMMVINLQGISCKLKSQVTSPASQKTSLYIYTWTYIKVLDMSIVLKIDEFVLSLLSIVIVVMRSLQEDNNLTQSGMSGKDVKVKVRGIRTSSALFKACCPFTPPQKKEYQCLCFRFGDRFGTRCRNQTSETFI